ncbi:DUF4097 domain-containing protein [bacterium]|nr:DUF4097 domain-containing protein [bacterium]
MRKNLFSTILVSVLVLNITSTIGFAADKDSFHLDEVYPLNMDGIITMITEDADIEIVASKRNDVHLVIDYEKKISGLHFDSKYDPLDFEIENEGGNLYIREIGGGGVFVGIATITRELYEIKMEIPETANLRLRGEDDDYIIQNVKGEIRLRSEDGDVKISEYGGNALEIESEDGDVVVSGGMGSLSIVVEDGDFYLEKGSYTNIDAYCEDGSIEIATSLDDNGHYRFRAEDGYIGFNVLKGGGQFEVIFEDGRVSAEKAFNKIEDDDEFEAYELAGGKAKVRFQIEDGRVRLSSE